MLMLSYWITYEALRAEAAGVAELTGRVTGIGVAEAVAEGEVLEPFPVFFCTTAETTWPDVPISL